MTKSSPSSTLPRFTLSPNQGVNGITYIYTTPTGETFFVKDVAAYHPDGGSDYQVLQAQREYVALKIMSLLGLKVPTELALIENDQGKLLLIKRKVADQEQNKTITSDHSNVDKDWFIRREFVLQTLNISDIALTPQRREYCQNKISKRTPKVAQIH